MAEQQKQPSQLTIKGIREGLLILVPKEEAWTKWVEALEQKIGAQPTFFQGARVILDIGARALPAEDLHTMVDMLVKHKIGLMGVISKSAQTRTVASEQGLRAWRVRPGTESAGSPDTSGRRSVSGSAAIFVERTVRSGQWVQYAGNVVVMGDVNPGAEVIAGGNIIVWGKLRGVVHAGASGDDNARVCALDLAPTQLRIGRHISRAPESRTSGHVVPEVATVRDDQIVVQAWT